MRDDKAPQGMPSKTPPFDGVKFMATNYLLGALVGVILSVAILATDTGGLRTLIAADGNPWLPLTLLTAAMALTFAGLYAAVSIMLTFRGKAGASRRG